MNRTTAIFSLVASTAIAIGVLLYAFSLDEWGDARGIAFPLVFLAALAVAIVSAVHLARGAKHR